MIAAGAAALLWKRYNPIKGGAGTVAAFALIAVGLVMGGYMANPLGPGGIDNNPATWQNAVPGTVSTVSLSGLAVQNATEIAVNAANNLQIDVTPADTKIPATGYDVNFTITALRAGSAGAQIVPISCTSPDFSNPSNVADSDRYNIVDKDTSGLLKIYIDGVQGAGALSFTEGSATDTATVYFDMSLSGRQKTNQYDSRYVTCDVGGKTVTVKVTHLSAAS